MPKAAGPHRGRGRRRRPLAAATLGVVLALAAGSRGTEPPEPAPSVRERVVRLQAARRRDLEEQARHERELAAARRQNAELRKSRDALRRRVEQLQERAARTRRSLAEREGTVTRLSAALRGRRDAARAAAREIRDAIRRSPPVADPSHARPFEDAARPGSTDVTPAETGDALATLVEACSQSLPRLRTSQVEGRRVLLPDGRDLHAFVLRLGAVHALFVSEDGATAGAWNAVARRWDPALSAEQDRAVREAVAIARGQRKVRLIAVPIRPEPPLDPSGEGER